MTHHTLAHIREQADHTGTTNIHLGPGDTADTPGTGPWQYTGPGWIRYVFHNDHATASADRNTQLERSNK